jgi:hypothetical protein
MQALLRHFSPVQLFAAAIAMVLIYPARKRVARHVVHVPLFSMLPIAGAVHVISFEFY